MLHSDQATLDRLLASPDPCVRFKVEIGVLGKSPSAPEVLALRQEIRSSPRVASLLSERDEQGKIPYHPYAKWYGAHWVLASLADIGYPQDDQTLLPLVEQALTWLLSKDRTRSLLTIKGLVRRCASQDGNALFYMLSLGLTDSGVDQLAQHLHAWQWPDGGWNCDRKLQAQNSSFMESLIPLRALALHTRLSGDPKSGAIVEQASEIFLKRRLYKRQADGRIIHHDFVRLHYPCYWHYDILFALTVMSEAGFLDDPRCQDALDLLAEKRLPEGGFPAEHKYYRISEKRSSGRSLVDWGGASKKRMNEFVSAEAFSVLMAAGRLL